MDSKLENKIKLVTIFIYILFLINMYIISKVGVANSYEISIYNAYPLLFWILLFLGISLSIVCIGISIHYYSNYWILHLLAIFLNYAIVFFLPVFRGYFLFSTLGYDLLVHLAFTKELLLSFYVPDNLIYPMQHIFYACLNMFGLPLNIYGISILNYLFVVIYILFFTILGKELINNKRGYLIFILFSCPLIFSFLYIAFMPFIFALFMVPLYIYILNKRNKNKNASEYRLLLIILSFFIVFCHPLVAITLIIYIIISQLFFKFISKSKNNFYSVISIILISFSIWYTTYNSFLNTLKKFVENIFEPDASIMAENINIVGSTNINLQELIELFIKTYFPIIVYLLIGIFCLLVILKNISKFKNKYLELFYSLQFIIILFISTLQLIIPFVIAEITRVLAFPAIISGILCGIIYNNFIKSDSSSKRKKVVTISLVLLLCFINIIGILNIYDSPWKGVTGSHLTKSDAYGFNWYLDYNNDSIPLLIDIQSMSKYQFYHSIFSGNPSKNINLLDRNIPSHFGYPINSTFYQTLNNESYMITYDRMNQTRNAVLETQKYKYPIYSNSDYKLLNNDSSVNKYYMNDKFVIWKVSVNNN